MADDVYKEAAPILEQLLKYTKQLASYETDPSVDVVALSRACGRRIEDLKKILPEQVGCLSGMRTGGGTPPRDERLAAMLEELFRQTAVCSKIFEKERSKAASQMEGIVRSRRAIKAYGA